MKLIKIKIENIRGIKYLELTLDSHNFVIWGPNGSGKSALIDAIDFLLTGKVTRLTGEGTKELILSKHGPHIDSTPQTAKVTATVKLHKCNKEVIISRKIDNPSRLIVNDESEDIMEELNDIQSLAKRGQHVLTRREILKYIHSESGTRAQEIQSLLNISEIESIRKNFVKITGACEREIKNAQKSVQSSQSDLNVAAQLKSFSDEELLKVVNSNRKILQGESIDILTSKTIKGELNPLVTTQTGQVVNVSNFEKYLESILNCLSVEKIKFLKEKNSTLSSQLNEIRNDEKLLRYLKQKILIDLGIELLGNDDYCPLCDTTWKNKELKDYLDEKKNKAATAGKLQASIEPTVKVLTEHFTNLLALLKQISNVIKEFDKLSGELEIITSWQSRISKHLNLLNDVYSDYMEDKYDKESMVKSFSPESLSFIDNIRKIVTDSFPKSTPEQTAWDTLTKLESYYQTYERTSEVLKKTAKIASQAELIHNSFESARDKILTELYGSISQRFVELYKALHGEDEKDFNANLKPDGAALKFEVGFYNHGNHPPNALHSEGHQDSMGLCLYLALNEKLTLGYIDLILLDDVVMSVDSTHRKSLCELISKYFANRQFIITTHDKTWSNQLQHEGVVKSKNKIEFYNWSIETGPHINYESDLWDRIYSDIQKNDIPTAAARLRRGSEEYFSQVCEYFGASVPFRLNNNYDLGELLSASIKQYNKLIGKAKSSAQFWKDNELFEKLKELDSTSSQIFTRIGGEQWAVNINVHYNDWADMGDRDFKPVAEAFEDLFNLFRCDKCGSLLKLIHDGPKPKVLKCNCGKTNLNLQTDK